jgi:RimJ/RimL family protein N-acetyltransferase
VRLVVNYAFNQLGLRRIYLEVLADNASAIRLYEKCGFKVEGTLRRHVFKDGKLKDVLIMAVEMQV